MAAVHPLLLFLILLFFFSSSSSEVEAAAEVPPMTDAAALLLLKKSFTNTTALDSWTASDTTGSPCNPRKPWAGIVCYGGIVTGLRLSGMGLGGTVDADALAHFRGLRSVSLDHNALSGTVPAFGRLHALKSLYLSNNAFSGPIPDAFFARMKHLKKLWLSDNAFSGAIPSSLSNASSLLELHLEDNRFSGALPALVLPALKSFNVSGNRLEGPVPASLVRFGKTSFDDNPGLCGEAVWLKACGDASAAAGEEDGEVDGGKGKLTVVTALLIVVLLSVVVAVAMAARRRRREREFDTLGAESAAEAMESAEVKPAETSSHKRRQQERSRGGSTRGGGGSPELVVVNDSKGQFGLADLMKSAAEVLGNGGLGSAYKAVMANGVAVVVKRLREVNRAGREGLDAEMRRLGRLRHPNVLPPLAYHFRKDEKLIVFEFVPRGNLLYLLHGDRSASHEALDWPTRLTIVRGIARGMAYLHTELATLDVPHGNLKSGNVLLGPDHEPLLVDYGLVSLVNPSAAPQALFAYKSPESLQYRNVSHKSDVYCLGIVILEILTGKFPSQYLNNTKGGTDVAQWVASAVAENREAELLDPEMVAEGAVSPEMEQLLRVGGACTEESPERRPSMHEAAAQIEEIAARAGLAEDGTFGRATSLVRSMSRSNSSGDHPSQRNNNDERS